MQNDAKPVREESYFTRKKRKIWKKYSRLFRYWVLRDPFPVEVRRWFKDKGDETLRRDYRLDEHSVVFDVGGYLGDFAQQIHDRYGCHVHLFEPGKAFFEKCEERFADTPKVICHNFGLGDANATMQLTDAADASSVMLADGATTSETVQIRQFSEVFEELKPGHIDLIKINIEGGEFTLLPHVIKQGLISKIDNVQVQFHNFIPGARKLRKTIREALSKTHKCDWCYTFVWENWSKK